MKTEFELGSVDGPWSTLAGFSATLSRIPKALLLGDGTSRAPLAQVLLDRFGNYLAQRNLAEGCAA